MRFSILLALAACAFAFSNVDGAQEDCEKVKNSSASHKEHIAAYKDHTAAYDYGNSSTVATTTIAVYPVSSVTPATTGAAAYTTKIIPDHYTTYCPSATEIPIGTKTYTVTEATTLTITDCPCTVTESVTPTASAVVAPSPVIYTSISLSAAAIYPTNSSTPISTPVTASTTTIAVIAVSPVAPSVVATPVVTSTPVEISSVAGTTSTKRSKAQSPRLQCSTLVVLVTGTGVPIPSNTPAPFNPNAGSALRSSLGGLAVALGVVAYML